MHLKTVQSNKHIANDRVFGINSNKQSHTKQKFEKIFFGNNCKGGSMSAGTYACIPEKFHYNGSNLARFHQNRGLIVAVSRHHQRCLSQMKLKETHPKVWEKFVNENFSVRNFSFLSVIVTI